MTEFKEWVWDPSLPLVQLRNYRTLRIHHSYQQGMASGSNLPGISVPSEDKATPQMQVLRIIKATEYGTMKLVWQREMPLAQISA